MFKANVETIPKVIIATTSSNVAPTIIVPGIFFFPPLPFSFKIIVLGIKTDGEIAINTNPNEKHKDISISGQILFAKKVSTIPSVRFGNKAIRIINIPYPLNVISNPPLTNITPTTITLIHFDQISG